MPPGPVPSSPARRTSGVVSVFLPHRLCPVAPGIQVPRNLRRDFDEPLFVAFAEHPERPVALLLSQRPDCCAQHVHAPEARADHQGQQRPIPQAEQC